MYTAGGGVSRRILKGEKILKTPPPHITQNVLTTPFLTKEKKNYKAPPLPPIPHPVLTRKVKYGQYLW